VICVRRTAASTDADGKPWRTKGIQSIEALGWACNTASPPSKARADIKGGGKGALFMGSLGWLTRQLSLSLVKNGAPV